MPSKRQAPPELLSSRPHKAPRVDMNRVKTYTLSNALPSASNSHSSNGTPQLPISRAPKRQSHRTDRPPLIAQLAKDVWHELKKRRDQDPGLYILIRAIKARNETREQVQRFNAYAAEVRLQLDVRKRVSNFSSASEPLPIHATDYVQNSVTTPETRTSQTVQEAMSISQVPHAFELQQQQPGNSAASTGSIMAELNARKAYNKELCIVMEAVNTRRETPEQMERYKEYVRQILAELNVQKRQESAPLPLPPKGSNEIRPSCGPSQTFSTLTAPPPILSKQPPRVHRPVARYSKHPESGVGANFHSVPYPISLLPFKSWEALHDGKPNGSVCSSCHTTRSLSIHQRKLFLVAERLSWCSDLVSHADRSRNEEALWAVNAELEIYDPAVEDDEIVVGGRLSRANEFFPFQSQIEAGGVMQVVAGADILTERSWLLWKQLIEDMPSEISKRDDPGAHDDERQPLGDISGNSRWLPSTEHITKVKGKDRAIIESLDLSKPLPTPPSSGTHKDTTSSRTKIDTLRDFYCVLDKLERTSHMAAKFLGAYAERLRDEVCQECWFKHHVLDDDELDNTSSLEKRPIWTKSGAASAWGLR